MFALPEILRRATPTASQPAQQSYLLLGYGHAHLAAATGHAHLQAGDHTAARAALTAALDHLPPLTAHRPRVLVLTDLATAVLHAGDLPDACRHATTAADLLHRAPNTTGATRLRAFRTMAACPSAPARCAEVCLS